MMKKAMFILEAAMKAQTMTEEAWKTWALDAAIEAGYTEQEAREALNLTKEEA